MIVYISSIKTNISRTSMKNAEDRLVREVRILFSNTTI